MAIPIWKDKIIDLGFPSVQFRIYDWDNSVSLYDGVAYAKPGEQTAKVRINDICADYLENILPNLSNGEVTDLAMKRFGVQVKFPGQSWQPLEDATFYNDWSYDYDFDPEASGLSCPINGHIDCRQPILYTAFNKAQVTATLVYKNGDTEVVVIPLTGEVAGADFNADYNDDYLMNGDGDGGYGTIVLFPGGASRGDFNLDFNLDFLIGNGDGGDENLDMVIIGNYVYKVVTCCAKYALYYVNAFGGWDSLLIEGNTLETDTLKRYTREVEYDNRDIRNRGTDNYVNEITKGFTFHTGWLLDDQGERMHHLINSTCVYLYDIANGDMIPVTIPTTSCEYRTYKNQGNRLVDYTIQVQVAKNRNRR